MKKECGMIRDLMPLVLDEVSSEMSKETVLDHVRTCSDCGAFFSQLKKDMPAKTGQVTDNDQKLFAEATSKLRRQKRLRALRTMLLGIVIACAVLLSGALGYDRLSKATQQIGLGDYQLMLSEMKDGTIVVTADYQGSTEQLQATKQIVSETDETTGEQITVLYIGMEKFLLSRKIGRPMQNGSPTRIPSASRADYDEIRQGTPDQFAVLWKYGDPIPAASEEMEQYYNWADIMDHYAEKLIEGPDGKVGFATVEDANRYMLIHRQWEALESIVPEWQPWVRDAYEPLSEDTIRWILDEDIE